MAGVVLIITLHHGNVFPPLTFSYSKRIGIYDLEVEVEMRNSDLQYSSPLMHQRIKHLHVINRYGRILERYSMPTIVLASSSYRTSQKPILEY